MKTHTHTTAAYFLKIAYKASTKHKYTSFSILLSCCCTLLSIGAWPSTTAAWEPSCKMARGGAVGKPPGAATAYSGTAWIGVAVSPISSSH